MSLPYWLTSALETLMVDVGHPTVFSTAYGFETDFSRCVLLQLFAEFLVFAAPVLHLLPIVENGALPVVGGSKEPDTRSMPTVVLFRMFRGIRRWDGDEGMSRCHLSRLRMRRAVPNLPCRYWSGMLAHSAFF